MFANCTLCQSSWFKPAIFVFALLLILYAIKNGVEGLVE